MRIFAISDLHLDATNSKPMNIFDDIWSGQKEEILKSYKKHRVRKTDVLILAGDLSWAMKIDDAKADFEFLKNFKCNVIILKGNHDYWWQSLTSVVNAMPKNVFVLQNNAVKFGKYVFCGTRGWNIYKKEIKGKEQDKKIYDREVIRLNLSIEQANKIKEKGDQLVCIMHYPPFFKKGDYIDPSNGFLDVIKANEIKTVVYGHLHGKHNYPYKTTINGTEFYLTSCDFLKNQIVRIK